MHTLKSFEQPIYTTRHIVKGLKMPMERVRDWLNRGYFMPSLESPKQGAKAYFSLADICRAELFRYLVEDKGVKREIADDLLKTINVTHSPLAFSQYLVFTTTRVGGKTEPRFIFVAGKTELSINISPDHAEVSWPDQEPYDKPDIDNGDDQPDSDPLKDWHDILVINLGKLRDRVRVAVEAVA